MAEVLEGEIVSSGTPRDLVPTPDRFELYTRKRRSAIIEALSPEDSDTPESYKPASFLSDAARHAGLQPSTLRGWLEHGESYPNGPLGRFNREVQRLIAERNDMHQKAIWDLAHKKKDWQGIARLGEQADAETWGRPKESTTNIQVNIVQKLEEAHRASGHPLTPGD